MQYITENNQIPLYKSCDVLVAGGGVAGASAALAAAREGAKVILLEREYILGGLGTAGLVTIYLPICDGMGTQVSYGIAEELLKLSMEHGYDDKYPDVWLEDLSKEERAKGKRYQVQFNPHFFAISLEKLLLKEGIEILYGTQAVSVVKNDDKIAAVITESKSGRRAIGVKSVVDATGDADICYFAGAKTEVFKEGNNLAAWYYYLKDGKVHLNMLGHIELADEDKKTSDTPENLSNDKFSGIDAEENSRFMYEAHENIETDVLRRRKKGDDVSPVTIASIPQFRMTRMIKGMYAIDVSDERKYFSDSIGAFSNWRRRGPAYELPFRCLYGNDVKNLITAGRCISSTQEMWDLSRVIPVCAVSGEAAGMAAAITDDFHTLDVTYLQKKLTEKGVKIHL